MRRRPCYVRLLSAFLNKLLSKCTPNRQDFVLDQGGFAPIHKLCPIRWRSDKYVPTHHYIYVLRVRKSVLCCESLKVNTCVPLNLLLQIIQVPSITTVSNVKWKKRKMFRLGCMPKWKLKLGTGRFEGLTRARFLEDSSFFSSLGSTYLQAWKLASTSPIANVL